MAGRHHRHSPGPRHLAARPPSRFPTAFVMAVGVGLGLAAGMQPATAERARPHEVVQPSAPVTCAPAAHEPGWSVKSAQAQAALVAQAAARCAE